MKVPSTRLEMMYASTMIQNPRIMPREVKAEDVHGRGQELIGIFGQANAPHPPEQAEDVVGKSDGVQRAKRAQAQERTNVS